MIRDSQDVVFNRTGRIEIPASHVRREVIGNKVRFQGFHPGAWSEPLTPATLRPAVLHIDVDGLMNLERLTIQDIAPVFEPAWPGCELKLPDDVISSGSSVSIQLTLALPNTDPRAGLVLARSEKIVVIEGTKLEGIGKSLLPVLPDLDGFNELYRLEISDETGPALKVNATIEGVSWRDLAYTPAFKFSILPGCVREILQYLVFHPSCRDEWGKPWLELDGVHGREIPDIEEKSPIDAWTDARDYATNAVDAFTTKLKLAQRFVEADTKDKERRRHQ
jgi:hypothetical protein